jgi:RimJ/RimL family protein N-acetyltransferase
MLESLSLRKVKSDDWKVLLEWRNDEITRKNSFNSAPISVNEHKEYLLKAISSPIKIQYIMEYEGIPVGTIREEKLISGKIELSYTIGSKFRGMKMGQMMMSLYLESRTGIFLCRVAVDNLPSIKMIEKLGYKFYKKNNGINFYELIKN